MLWNNVDVSEPGDQQLGDQQLGGTSIVGDAAQKAEGNEQLSKESTVAQKEALEKSGKKGSSSKTGAKAAPEAQGPGIIVCGSNCTMSYEFFFGGGGGGGEDSLPLEGMNQYCIVRHTIFYPGLPIDKNHTGVG